MFARSMFFILALGVLPALASLGDLKFPEHFQFGLATAPAHVEDQLADTWSAFAKQGRVAAVPPQIDPEARLRFWTNPEIEIELAAKTGVQIFRWGVDWGRLVPQRPGSMNCGESPCSAGVQDQQALRRYKEILQMIKAKNMKSMVTLFHHSSPRWFAEQGGWTEPATKELFDQFANSVYAELGDGVDYWITFNEPTIFALLTYVTGTWPLGKAGGWMAMLDFGFYRGPYAKALHHMIQAHKDFYEFVQSKNLAQGSEQNSVQNPVHETSQKSKSTLKPLIGIAHHYSYLLTAKGQTTWLTRLLDRFWNWSFPDAVEKYVDFIGVNYYGAEFPFALSSGLVPGQEYSEAGRAVSPQGLYQMLKRISQRSAKPIWITENGFSDRTDWLRPAYLIEHLAAVHRAITEGVAVQAYIFWTISDNWEWADGYCPRFGLVDVDRLNNLKRTARPSYQLFTDIVAAKSVLQQQRSAAWQKALDHQGQMRPMCRAENGVDGLNEPQLRPVQNQDWRFY